MSLRRTASRTSKLRMYESLYAAATEAGDTQTAALAKQIQAEEQATAEKLFARIAPLARIAVVTGTQS